MIVGAICTRGGSKGVPGKALRPVAGRSLLEHAVACALSCETIQRVVVSTDDAEIAASARSLGAEVPWLRPAHLATDEAPKWEVFRHLLRELETTDDEPVEVLVDLDVSVPLRAPEDVDGAVGALLESDLDLVVTAYPADRNPYFNQVEPSPDGGVRVVKRPAAPIHGRQQAPPVFNLSPAVYAIRRDALRRFGHWSEARMGIHPVPRERAWDIDDELDLRFVELLFAEREGS
jgi:N-acylneuraminate cytidylyltransferase/CMP-N,N'-diacetyllegionaminic acid synthase